MSETNQHFWGNPQVFWKETFDICVFSCPCQRKGLSTVAEVSQEKGQCYPIALRHEVEEAVSGWLICSASLYSQSPCYMSAAVLGLRDKALR